MASRGFVFPPPPPPPPTTHFNPATSSDGLPMDWRGRGRGRGQGGFGRGHHGNRPNFSRGGGAPGHNPNFPGRGTGANRGGWNQDRQGRGSSHNGAGRGQKRRHDQAFNKPAHIPDRPIPPPSVPSYGFDLNTIIAPPKAAPQKPQQPPKRNIFGLAPSVDDRESETEEDEEARFAKAHQANGSAVHISGEGIQMSLHTPEEIAAWIAERKRNRPTKAKAEAAAAKAKEEAEKRAQERAAKAKERQAAVKEKADRRKKQQQERQGKGKGKPNPSAPTESQMLQAELDKARQRVAELEKLQKVSKAGQRGSKSKPTEKLSSGPSKSTDTDTAEAPTLKDALLPDDLEQLMVSSDDEGENTVSGAQNDDETSSSGTSSEDESSDDEDGDAPLELSSKDADMQKAHIRQELRKCTNFARTGRCPRGRKCPFKHEPTTKNMKAREIASNAPPRRGLVQGKSLYQRLQEQQEDTLDDLVMQHILYLGDNGYLDPPLDEKAA